MSRDHRAPAAVSVIHNRPKRALVGFSYGVMLISLVYSLGQVLNCISTGIEIHINVWYVFVSVQAALL